MLVWVLFRLGLGFKRVGLGFRINLGFRRFFFGFVWGVFRFGLGVF